MGLVQAKVEGAFARMVRTLSGLGANLLEPSRRIAEALGADDVAARVAAVQSSIANVVSDDAVRAADARASAFGQMLGASVSGVGRTFSGRRAAIATELTALYDQASSAIAGATAGSGASATSTRAGPAPGSARSARPPTRRRARSGACSRAWSGWRPSARPRSPRCPRSRRAGRGGAPTASISPTARRRTSTCPVAPASAPSTSASSISLRGYQVAFDAIRSTVDGVAYAIGDAVSSSSRGGTPSSRSGRPARRWVAAWPRLFQGVVADITAAIAKALILKGLLALVGGPSAGFLGGVLSTLAGPTAGMTAGGALAVTLNVSGGELRMGNGYLVAALRAGLAEEVRTGAGPGVL